MPSYSLPAVLVICLVTAAGLLVFLKRSLRYLQYFQQEEYENGRFFNWYLANKAWDKIASPLVLIPLLAAFFLKGWLLLVVAFITEGIALFLVHSEEDPLKAGKLTLKMTDRVKRIHRLATLFYVLAVAALTAAVFYGAGGAETNLAVAILIIQFLLIQSIPLWLLFSNAALDPYEKSLQENFANQARAVLKDIDPTVIGITGSYGKTSTKILLKDIIGAVYPTFSTPGSVNTYMGVTRKIREEMKPEHKFAVIEMGAYYEGSIKRMCSLTPPRCGIVTTVGLAHLERFGSQETIYRAKSELAQAIPEDGVLVVNGDNAYTRKMAQEFPKKTTLLYGMDSDSADLDARMFDINYGEEGTSFKISFKGEVHEGFTRLLGRPMLENVLGAFTMACAVGVPPEVALAVIRNAKPESNRLELQRGQIGILAHTNGTPPQEGNIIRLNDAYNSNPVGFGAALEVLAQIPGGRKILVTPGMIELGEMQFKENKACARNAASVCDFVLVIGDTNSEALLEGLKEGGLAEEKYRSFREMKEALYFLATEYCRSGDVVLIENDLPDLYEGVVKF